MRTRAFRNLARQAAALLIALSSGAVLAAPQVVASVPLPDPVRWDYVSVDPVAHRLYVAHRERVDVIDTQTNLAVLRLTPTPGVHGAAAASDLGRVFTSNGGEGTVGVFDARSGELLKTLKAGKNPDAIVYEPVSHRVFAFNGGSSDATVIDARSLTVLEPAMPLPGSPEFAVVDGHGHVYLNLEDKSELAVLDGPSLRIERHFGLAPCEEPSGLTIDPEGRLYSVCRNALLVVSDPALGKVVGHAPIGHGADGVAWLDGRAYSANGRDGTISVVAETAQGRFETVATIPTAQGARTIAADPDRHQLFSPTADFKAEPASGAGRKSRPEAIPGTFRVLVIEDSERR